MTYARYPLIYGLSSGALVAAVISAGLLLKDRYDFVSEMWFGYLAMIVALTFLFVGVKRYRDVEKGGVIKFLPALGLGLAIAIVSAVAYALVWEIYLALTGYRFIEDMAVETMRSLRERGASAAEIAASTAYFEWARDANPFTRVGITMTEILPVGVLMALISAIALMFPKVLPARNVAPARTKSVDEAGDDVAIGA